ncbi:hypothetical protein OIO90_004487 [Microbotryomycetes sp. JL221]|nr:hypothetical protein OIO90_004487 [Microbotryomycetes sp. JL221]
MTVSSRQLTLFGSTSGNVGASQHGSNQQHASSAATRAGGTTGTATTGHGRFHLLRSVANQAPTLTLLARTLVKLVLSSLLGLVITVSVFVFMYRRPIMYILFGDDRSPTLTEINTERNRTLNGQADAKGFDYRRRQVLRNGFMTPSKRHQQQDGDDTSHDSDTSVDDKWFETAPNSPNIESNKDKRYTVLSKPNAAVIKSCMRHHSSSTSTSHNGESRSKSVRLVDSDELDTLEALREFWAKPTQHGIGVIHLQHHHGSSGGPSSTKGSGIAGYRRTREIYMRGQAAPRQSRRMTDGSNHEDNVDDSEQFKLDKSNSQTGRPLGNTSVRLCDRTLSPAGSPRLGYNRASSPPLGSLASTAPFKSSGLRSSSPSVRGTLATTTATRGGSTKIKRTSSVSPGRAVSGANNNDATTCAPKEDEIVLPRWIKSKAAGGNRKSLVGPSQQLTLKSTKASTTSIHGMQNKDKDNDDDGFEDCSDRSGTSTPTGLGETLTPFTKIEVK